MGEVEGPAAGLAVVDDLELEQYDMFHATRADLLVRLGRPTHAAEAYGVALALTTNAAQRAFLGDRRRSALAAG